MSWVDQAACKGLNPNMFLPARGANHDVAAAKAVCAQCPVRTPCLEDQLDAVTGPDDIGIWGGTTPHERRPLRRLRRAAA